MTVVFYLIAALTVAGALAAVLLKNLVHCALAVTVAFGGLALLFLSLDAQFAGFVQILVYIGAVAILIVFAILLTRGSDVPKDGVFSPTWLTGVAIAAAVFAVIGWAVINSVNAIPQQAAVPQGGRRRAPGARGRPASAGSRTPRAQRRRPRTRHGR